MAVTTDTKGSLIRAFLYSVPTLVVVLVFSCLLWALHRRQEIASVPQYYQDPRAPRICLCLWEGTAFRFPCEDIPPELLKE